MKITKKKEVVTEEIELLSGTYYFECYEGSYHKIILEENEGFDYIIESIENYASPYGIRVRKDWIADQEELPYKFEAFILGKSGKKIEKEDFEEQKKQVIERIINI